jgi:hypothetical protein
MMPRPLRLSYMEAAVVRIAGFALLALVAAGSAPALAAPSLDATVTVYTPDRSGRLPEELGAARATLEQKGYTGASVRGRQVVHLDLGVEREVMVGRTTLGLELLSVDGGKARVEVVRPMGPPTVTSVNLADPRFYVLVAGS